MAMLEVIDRPVGGCVTDLCQLNTMLEAQMYADSNESDLVYTYIALARHNMPPTFTFGVTLVGVINGCAQERTWESRRDAHPRPVARLDADPDDSQIRVSLSKTA